MTKPDWHAINRRIAQCRQNRTPQETIACLEDLFKETGDGMVVFALAEEYENAGEKDSALRLYREAERRFPMEQFKRKARMAIEHLSARSMGPPVGLDDGWVRAENAISQQSAVKIIDQEPTSTLIVVSCTKKKIWDRSPSAPEYVPARYTYIGDSFLRFVNWADKQQLERRGFRWMILSGKYGYIEPWHPISYYDIPIDDESYFPVTNDFLKNQVRQVRWYKNPDGCWAGYNLNQFDRIVCVNCSQAYQNKVQTCFPDKSIEWLEI